MLLEHRWRRLTVASGPGDATEGHILTTNLPAFFFFFFFFHPSILPSFLLAIFFPSVRIHTHCRNAQKRAEPGFADFGPQRRRRHSIGEEHTPGEERFLYTQRAPALSGSRNDRFAVALMTVI